MKILSISGLSKQFGGVKAVSDVSFEVAPSSVHGLIGPNGAGKTTCFNLVAGVFPATAGNIYLNGKDITSEPGWKRARRGVARTFQNIALLEGTSVEDNLLHVALSVSKVGYFKSFARTSQSRAIEEKARYDVAALIDDFGLADFRFAYAEDIPIGFQRRVEIARALLCEPKILLLDEPVAGMNARESAEIAMLIEGLKSKFSVLLVEHDMSLVMSICDSITVLDQGTIIAEGEPTVIQNDSRVMEAYLGTVS